MVIWRPKVKCSILGAVFQKLYNEFSAVEAMALLQNTKGLNCDSPAGFTTSSTMNLFPPLGGLHGPQCQLDCIAQWSGLLELEPGPTALSLSQGW